ncbi:MAG: hypothetical protein ABW167_11230 [Baekduia sp.]
MIEELQPYHRRKWPQTQTLWDLHQLSNWDKHRMLLASAAALEGSQLNVVVSGPTTVRSERRFRGRAKPGAIVARFEMGYSEPGAKVHVNPHLAFLDVFDQRSPETLGGRPIRTTLANIGNFIDTEVVPRFERFV